MTLSSSSSPPPPPSAYKTFTRGAVISLFGVLLAGIISYLTRRVLVLHLSPLEYGFFYSVFAFVSLGLAVVDLGLGQSGTVLMAKYAARGKMGRVNLFFSIIKSAMIFFIQINITIIRNIFFNRIF